MAVDLVDDDPKGAITGALFPPDTDPAVIARRLREIADEQKAAAESG